MAAPRAVSRRAEHEPKPLHDLCHAAASYLAMSGATLAELAKILGHETLHEVKRHAHLSEAHMREAMERMHELLPQT